MSEEATVINSSKETEKIENGDNIDGKNEEPVATKEFSKKINIINKETVHQICSGQVVLDLAVAIKELVENSLDSGATIIDVKLTEYGRTCITVSDNGSGVLESDFEGLGLKHYTSKLRDFSDIFEVSTFGFRGEALSSLCSLSEVSITTKHKNTEHAFKLQFDKNGLLQKKEICARENGTTVSVKNIFKSLPVRAKEFQRNIKKEFTRAVQVLYGYCLVSTGIKITCSNTVEGKSTNTIVSTCGSSNVLDNAVAIFGKKSLAGVEEVPFFQADESVMQEFGLSGEIPVDFTWDFFASSIEHGMGRASPDRQFFFVNGRPCNLVKANKLINNIYHKFNDKQYPFIFLNLKLNQSTTDVNVTPDKRTVFLTQEKLILATMKMSLQKNWENMQGKFTTKTLEQLQNSLKRSLSSVSKDNVPPLKKQMFTTIKKEKIEEGDDFNVEVVQPKEKMKHKKEEITDIYNSILYEKLSDAEMKIGIESIKTAMNRRENAKAAEKKLTNRIKYRAEIDPGKNAVAEEELKKQLTTESFGKMRIIGQFNLGFIVAELEDDLFIIDQHATDEKFRFEKLNNETKLKTQKLIIPKPLNLASLNETIIVEHQEFFDANGFTLSINPEAECGQRVMLTGIPVSGNWQFDQEDIEELIFLIREGGSEGTEKCIGNGKILRPSRVRQMLASRACRGAVMIGKALNFSEMRRLIDQMGMMQNPWNCPHGRPTIRHLLSLKLLNT